MKITGDKSDLSISQAGAGTATLQCEDPTKQVPISQLPGPLENMDGSHNGEVTAPGTEDASEGSSVITQNEGSSQTFKKTEDIESKPVEIVKSQTQAAEEKECDSKDLKTTDLSSDDEGIKRDSSKKKSKKHKKHKSKKKKKKKKKEKNEKRSKSHSSVEDQENGSSVTKSVWQPVSASPKEQDTSNTLSSQMEENLDALPSLGCQDHNVDSVKEHPARPQLDVDSGFFGPKCPNEMHFSVSSNLTIPDVQMQEPSKELAVDIQQNNKNKKSTDQNNENLLTNCEPAEALHNEVFLPQQGLVLSEEKDVELQESRLDSEENKDYLKQSDNASSQLLQSQSKSSSTSLSKLTAKLRSRSNSLARENRSRSKSLTKVPKKQASSKSLTRQRSRSSSVVRRRRSRSSSVGQRRRSKSKSPVRRRRSQSSTPARYSKSPIRSWWSKSIRNRQRSVSIERRRRSRTRSFERRRRSRTRSLVRKRRSRSRSSEKGHNSKTRSSAKRIRSRSHSLTRRRKSRSTSRKHRLRSRSASRRKSKSAVRTPSKSNSPSRKRKSKSVSPPRRQKSKSSSPVRRGRSRSRSAVQKRRSRSGATFRRHRSRSGSGSRRRKSRSGSFTRRRRSRSSLTSRRRKSRSGSAFRRRRSRSVVASRRRRSRSLSVSRRRRSKSPSVSRRRRSRSPSVSRRRRSRSPSVSRRRKSRSASTSRRRRSWSASRRRRSRTPSVTRRRRSRSTSRRRRSRSASRRRKSRSASRRRRSRSATTSRRHRSRSASASRRHKSRSVSRRHRSRSDSASRRRRSRSDSVSRRRRSRSDSTSRQRASRFDSKRRKSRSGSNTRRPRSNSQQNSRSYSANKRKSRSTSVSRGEQSTLLSSASKVQSREVRRSRSKGENRTSRSRSSSVNMKSVESETTLQSKSSTEQRLLETASLDEKPLSASTVEQHNKTVLPDNSSALTESKSESSVSRSSSQGAILVPCTDNAIEVESNVLGSSTTSLLDDKMKSGCSQCPTEEVISSTIPFNEDTSTECDMEIEPVAFTPIETACPEQLIEVVNMVETSKEAFEFESTNDYTKQHTNLEGLRTDNEPQQKTVCKQFGGSSDSGQIHGLSHLEERSLVVPVEEPNNLSCHDKPEYVESKPEISKSSDSSLKESENSVDNIATSPNLKFSSISPFPNCLEVPRDAESNKSVKNADTDVSQMGYISSAISDYSSITVKQNIPVLLAEKQVEHLYSSSTIEGKSHVSLPNSSNDLDLLHNEQEHIMNNSLILNEGQHFPVVGSSVFPGSQKDTEEEVSASMLGDYQRDISNFKMPTLHEDKLNRSESKEKIGKSETSTSEVDKQRMELKNSVKNTLTAEQSFSNSPTQSSSHDISICNETKSALSCVTQSSLLVNSSYKELISNYDFKEMEESEVSHAIDNKTIEEKPMNENKKILSSMHTIEALGSTCQVEESFALPESSPYEVNSSQAFKGDEQNVHHLLKQDGESINMEEISASESALQDSPVAPIVNYHEIPRSKEPTTSITNLTGHVSPSKLRSSIKIGDSLSHKVPQCMSVSSGEFVKRDLSLLAEDKMEIQGHYKVLSNTSNTESYSEESKIGSKTSPFNSVNDNCDNQKVGKFSYADSTQVDNSANRMPSSDPEAIYHFEKTINSREQNSSSALPSEKHCSSSSNDANLQSIQLSLQEKEFSQNTENTILNTKTKELCFGEDIPQRDTVVSKHSKLLSVTKDSENDSLANSTENKIHVNDDKSQEKSISSCLESGPDLYFQQELLSKDKETMNVEKENSVPSLIDIKQPELKTKEQSTPNNSKPEPAYISLRESKPQEEPKSSPKSFLHETGRLSVSSVPVQFKFSKTFKTLGVSQLCSTSEDSSDVEISKVNSSSVTRNITSASGTAKSGLKTLPELPTIQHTASVSGESKSEYPQNVSTQPSQSDHQSGQLSEKDVLHPDNIQAADDSQSGSSTKHPFPHISNAVSKLGVKQRQYRSRSVAQDSRTPSADRGRASRSRSKSRRRRSKSKSSSRKKRSSSTTRKKSLHSKSDRRKRSRSRSRGRKGRSQSKSKGKKKRSTSKLSAKRKRSTSKSLERLGSSKSSGKQRSSRSTSKNRKKRLQSKSPEKKGRSRSKSESRKNLHSKTATSRKRSRSKSPIRRRKSRSKSLSSRSRSRSVSASWKRFSHSKSSLHRKRSHSSSRSASPRRSSHSRNKRRSFSRSPAARSHSRSRSRWRRSRSRGRWRRSRSLSATRHRSRSTSRVSSSLSSKKRKSLSPVRRRRSRSQNKQKDKSPVSKRKSTSPPPPPPQKKSAQLKPAGFKHSIGLKSLIQKQLSQAKAQGSTGKLSKEQIPLPNLTSRTQLSMFSTRSQASVSNLSNIGQIPVPNLAEVPLPSVSAGSHIPMPPAEPLSVSSLAAETQLSVPDLTTANQWHVPDMSSGAPWSVPDIAAGTPWSMADLGAGAQWPMSDLTAGSHWPMHDLSVGAQWSMPDLAAGTQWAVPDVATGAQWAVPDLTAGTQWTVPDLTAGSHQWAMTNMTAAQWAVPDLAATAQWTVPDLTAGAQMQRADLVLEAQVPGSDLAPEAQVPGSDLATEAQVPGSDLAAEAQVPGSDLVAEAQVPPEHDLILEEHNVMPDVAAEALVPVASSTVVPDVAAGTPLPDVAAAAHMPVPDVAATIHMPDVATEAQKQMSDFVATQAYISLTPEESIENTHYDEPILSSEHQTESNSCEAFVQESSFEPSVNTSPNLKMEETLSSGQQVPLDCSENFQSNELSDETISVDKPELQLNQDPETDILVNASKEEPVIDSESHLSIETCRSSDVPFVSCEGCDYSVLSMSVESDPLQEHSLFDGNKDSGTSLQCDPDSGSNRAFVESQTSPVQTEFVEPSENNDQPQLPVKDSVADNNLQIEPYNTSDHTLMEEQCSESVCSKWVPPYASPENILQTESSVNSNTTLDINAQSISHLNEIETCVPKHSRQVELNNSLNLSHPTERLASPEHPQLVEPYSSPDHPQLVEPYISPVHPQLVEPYPSPQHPPLVELYSSPERPQLVEPYASPDFPQLVEPYTSPDRQQLVEPYSDTQDTDISQPCPDLTENACSPAEKPEGCSISGHILTHAAVTCTQINTDSSCSDDSIKNDFSQLHEYPVVSDVPKNQDEIVDSDYPRLSNSNNTSVSLQEVPCPSLLKTYSLESNFSPKETNAEECSPTERREVEPSIGSYLEESTSPAQLLAKLSSPQTVDQEEQFPIPEHKPLNSCTLPDEPKLDSPCISTSEQLVREEIVTDDLSKSEELCSVKEGLGSHVDCISSEQVQEQLLITPVHPQEDVQSTSEPYTNEPCLNTADATLSEYEQSSVEEPRSCHPDNNLCIPVLSTTIINLCGGDPSCTIISSPDTHEQETIADEHSHSEESKNTSDFHDRLLATRGDELLDKPPHSSDSDSQKSCSSSSSIKLSDSPNRFLPEHSSNADPSMPSQYSNQSLDQTNKTDSPTTSVFKSQAISLDRCIDTSVPTENASFPAELPSSNQDMLQCSTSDQTSDFSVECMKHKLEDSVEDIKTDHFTTTPPDLLPYDSEQPTDVCSEPSSEPVPFISQPPPELLPYDSEQPANSFLSISDYSAEQGSSDFHAPPELLPYDSDQPMVMHNQQTEPTAEVLPIYDSTTVHHKTNKTFDIPTVDSVEYCDNSLSLNTNALPEKCELSNDTVVLELNSVKEVSSECSAMGFPSSKHTFTSEPLQEHSVPHAVDCIEEDPSSCTTVDKQFPAQQLAENEKPSIQAVGSEIPEHLISRVENQTEQTLLTSIPDTSEVQCTSSYELVTPAETESATILPLQNENALETARSSPPRPLANAECPQPQSVSKMTDSIAHLESGLEHSQSTSIDRKKSRSKSVSKNKRSRSKSVTPTKKSHSKSLVRSKKSKSRSASAESNRRSPAVKRKESSYVVHKRHSRSPSVGCKRRSRSSSLSPRKRSRSSSVGHKFQRRHSRSPSEFRKQSRSPSVTHRRRSRSSSAAHKRRSPSTSLARKKISPSPVSRRRRSPSASRRRRSPSPPSRRRRTPSPPASRRRRSPSATRRRRSRSPSANRRRRSPTPTTTRRRRSPSPSTTRRRRSPSPSASRRRRSPSPPASRRRRSPSPSSTRRRRSPSPSASRRRRSPSPSVSRRRRSPSSEIRRKRSPSLSVSHKRHSHSPSQPRKRRSRSTSASRRRRSRSASQRKSSRSPSAPRKRRSKSKSPSKSPSGIQSKSERSRSLSQSEVSRKRKTRSRSSSRDKKTVEKRRKRSSSKDSSKDYYSIKQRRKSRTPPRRKKSRSPSRRASVCKSPVRRRPRSRSPIRRKSFSRSPIRRKRSRSRDKSLDSARSPKRLTDLDKAQLLEIAKANAAAMCAKAGVPLPPSLKPVITPAAPVEEKITHRTYGVTIQELTEKCKQIAQSKEDDVIVNKPHDSDDEEEDRPFYNHPFKVSEHKPISFSLLNPSLKPAPKTQVTLTKEFPVSSGSQHRKKESDKVYGEWVPVDKTTEESKDDVFTNTGPTQPVDITSAMNERAVAQTRLTGNPYDIEALFMLNRAQEQIDAWAQSTSIPGQFTGSTGAQVLSAEEISNSGPQAWLKKDQFLKAAPVTGGRGALLMRKMGWKEGEGLGRNNEGNVDPILLDFKTDRKGLVADGEKASNKLALPAMKDLSGKHPISALMELCNKKKWSPPEFELVDDTGPEHRKRFLFRVTVNGVLCQPSQPSVTKKLAKATAAAAALQALGALPKENMTSTSNFCSASSSTL